MPIIPALSRLRQEDQELEASLGCRVTLSWSGIDSETLPQKTKTEEKNFNSNNIYNYHHHIHVY
jgi:hypothetical protein